MVQQAGTTDAVLLHKALDLYQGDYLPDAQYEPWVAEEREHLISLFLESADRLTELYLKQEQYAEVISLSQRILSKDACWERAYRHLMLAYHHLGDRGQVARVFQRCNQSLREELDVSPSTETCALFEHLTGQ